MQGQEGAPADQLGGYSSRDKSSCRREKEEGEKKEGWVGEGTLREGRGEMEIHVGGWWILVRKG